VIDWQDKGASLLNLYGRAEEALACYDRALEIQPAPPRGWNSKGRALSSAFKREEALACYDRALAMMEIAAALQVGRGTGIVFYCPQNLPERPLS
jgi:tetratricopeptide (TPR) repeat protein